MKNQSGGSSFIELPEVQYTFIPHGGRELDKPNGDPTTVVKISFDSEVVYLDSSGNWETITHNNLKDVLEVYLERFNLIESATQNDVIQYITSVSTINNKTVIEIGILWPNEEHPHFYALDAYFPIVLQNYAKKADVQKIVQSRSLDEYLNTVTSSYENFFVWPTLYYNMSFSCNLSPQASEAQSSDISTDSKDKPPVFCGVDDLEGTP